MLFQQVFFSGHLWTDRHDKIYYRKINCKMHIVLYKFPNILHPPLMYQELQGRNDRHTVKLPTIKATGNVRTQFPLM